MKTLPETGFLRLNQILEFIPIGKSTWWYKTKNDPDWPQPVKLGPKITVWRAESIHQLINKLSIGDQ